MKGDGCKSDDNDVKPSASANNVSATSAPASEAETSTIQSPSRIEREGESSAPMMAAGAAAAHPSRAFDQTTAAVPPASVENSDEGDAATKTSAQAGAASISTARDSEIITSINSNSVGPLEKSRNSRNSEGELQPGAVSVAGIDSERTEGEAEQTSAVSGQQSNTSTAVTDSQISAEFLQASCRSTGTRPEEVESEEQSNVLVQAELVPPAVQAVSVTIDEEQPHHLHSVEEYRRQHSGDNSTKDNHHSGENNAKRKWIVIGVAIVSVCVLLAIVIPITVIPNPTSDASTAVTSPSPAPTFDYPCFTSTYDLLWAQLNDLEASNFTKTKDVYIVCPGSYIKIGTFRNPAKNDFLIVEGDQPLTAITNDTLIQCGLDGNIDNNCTLDGGFSQVMLQRVIPGIDPHDPKVKQRFFELNLTVHNVTIRGFTFTGKNTASGTLSGVPFLLSQTGNVTVEDCRFTDLTPATEVIAVGQNVYQASEAGGFEEVPTHSSTLTIRRCQFDDIVYDAPMIYISDQIVHVEECIFANVTVSALPQFSCLDGQGCAGLMACMSKSQCSVSNSCVFNVETLGPGLIFMDLWQSAIGPAGIESGSAGGAPNATEIAEARLASFNNNYLDNESFSSCEVVGVVGTDLIVTDCIDGLAFQADQCALEF